MGVGSRESSGTSRDLAKVAAAISELTETSRALRELADAALGRFSASLVPRLRSSLVSLAGEGALIRFDGRGTNLSASERDVLFQEEVLESLGRVLSPVELLLLPDAAMEVSVRAAQLIARRL